MHALYILTVKSAYNSCIVYSYRVSPIVVLCGMFFRTTVYHGGNLVYVTSLVEFISKKF